MNWLLVFTRFYLNAKTRYCRQQLSFNNCISNVLIDNLDSLRYQSFNMLKNCILKCIGILIKISCVESISIVVCILKTYFSL